MRVIVGKATAPNGLEAERYLAGRTDRNGVAYVFRNYRDIVGAHPLGITIAKLDPTVAWVRREGKCAVGVGESRILVPVVQQKATERTNGYGSVALQRWNVSTLQNLPQSILNSVQITSV